MQIFINDVEVETTLTNEKNLADVYEEVRRWVEAQGKFLMQCLADGVEYSVDELAQIAIQPSTRMHFYVGENIDVLVSTLLELDSYIDKVGTTLLGKDSLTEQEQSDLADGLVWIREVLLTAAKFVKLDYSRIRPIPQGNTVAQTYANLLELGEKLNSSSNIENFLENLRDLKLFVMSLTGKIMALAVDMQTLTNVIKAYSHNMDVLKNEFVRVNENLQAGKEIVAGQILSHATERLQVLLHAIIALQAKLPEQLFSELEVEGMTLEEAIEKLKVLLSRVVRSFEANDLVSAGDILEYELPDVLDRLVPFLRAISNS